MPRKPELPFLAHWRNALRDSELPSTWRLGGFVIATYSNARGETFVGKRLIADGMGARSTRTADAVVNGLEASGFLRIVAPSRGRRFNAYELTIPTLHGAAGFEEWNHATREAQPRTGTASTPHRAAPESGLKAKAKAWNVFATYPDGYESTTPALSSEAAEHVASELRARGCAVQIVEEATA